MSKLLPKRLGILRAAATRENDRRPATVQDPTLNQCPAAELWDMIRVKGEGLRSPTIRSTGQRHVSFQSPRVAETYGHSRVSRVCRTRDPSVMQRYRMMRLRPAGVV